MRVCVDLILTSYALAPRSAAPAGTHQNVWSCSFQLETNILSHFMICQTKRAIHPTPQDVIEIYDEAFHSMRAQFPWNLYPLRREDCALMRDRVQYRPKLLTSKPLLLIPLRKPAIQLTLHMPPFHPCPPPPMSTHSCKEVGFRSVVTIKHHH
jgi:hypothetical protein